MSVMREDDMLSVHVSVHYPPWLDELSIEEFDDVMNAAENKAIVALATEIYRAEQFWRARKAASIAGQMDIYEYV